MACCPNSVHRNALLHHRRPGILPAACIFGGPLRRRGLDRAFPGGRISYPGIGILSHPGASGGSVMTGVIEGTPAEKPGMLRGDTADGPLRQQQ